MTIADIHLFSAYAALKYVGACHAMNACVCFRVFGGCCLTPCHRVCSAVLHRMFGASSLDAEAYPRLAKLVGAVAANEGIAKWLAEHMKKDA